MNRYFRELALGEKTRTPMLSPFRSMPAISNEANSPIMASFVRNDFSQLNGANGNWVTSMGKPERAKTMGISVALLMTISQIFPMTQVVQAQDKIATGHTRARIVLKIGDEPVR